MKKTIKRGVILFLLAIIFFILAVAGIKRWYNNQLPYFQIRGYYFAANFAGSYCPRVESDPQEMDRDPEWQGLTGEYLGEIEKETSFPSRNLEEFEGFKIETGTKIYTINMELAGERQIDGLGLLLETGDGKLYYMVPYFFAGEEKDMFSIIKSIRAEFYPSDTP
ncbi:MAG: hypothetical protein HFI38_02995 [Lachnospiraceae bacterium]|jgi:hypothetical protein|nr:hypothetical protein [Lachnospiraceae bacterium]